MANGHGEVDSEKLNKEGCEYGRTAKRRIDNMEKDLGKVIDNLQNRPSWPVAMTITTMSSLIVGLSVALIVG